MPGRKPDEVKKMHGTLQPCRASQGVHHEKVDRIPDPPAWLSSPYAREEWHRVAPILHGMGLLTHAGLTSLAVMCAQFAVIAKAAEQDQEIIAAAINAYRGLANDFGLTPVAATRVKPTENKPDNPFAKRGLRAVS